MRNEPGPPKHCVICGSNRVTRKRISVRLRTGRTVRDVEADVCPVCGERYYDLAAMQRLASEHARSPE